MRNGARVPVLLYHSVRNEPTPGYERWETSPDRLRIQLDQLTAAGRTAVSLPTYARWLRGGDVILPDRPVVITFDDGFANFLDIVPLFLERACPVTMFVPTAYVGGESDWLAPRFRRQMLTWSQLAELDRSGIEIGSHGHLHRPIDTLRRAPLRGDVTHSRELIEDHLGHACASFAYPHGYYSQDVRRAVADAGFVQACAVKDAMSGTGDDPMAVARLFVGWHDVADQFDRLLVAGHRRRARYERVTTRGWRTARRMRARMRSSV
jgi:peptidoglycan/xylan/chitin deacetylase (PgdA/CDA1 family)